MNAVAVEDLRRLQDAGVALSEDGLARIADADRASEAAEDARAARASEAAEALAAAQSVYESARKDALTALAVYVEKREAAGELRLRYEAAWALAAKHGVADVRLEPAALPMNLSHRLLSVPGRW